MYESNRNILDESMKRKMTNRRIFGWLIFSALICALFIIDNNLSLNNDKGLLRYCWSDTGYANFNIQACDTYKLLRWPDHRIPLNVQTEAREDTIESINEINNLVGCTILLYQGPNYEGHDVDIKYSNSNSFHRMNILGSTLFSTSNNEENMTAHIMIFDYANLSYDRRNVIKHELGHALGLDHDLNRNSIMAPQEEFMEINTFFTKSDIELLRTNYCQQ